MPRQGAYFQTGEIIDYTNTSAEMIDAGQVVLLNSRIGFAVDSIAPGTNGGIAVTGVFTNVPAETTAAFAVGDVIYWDDTNKKITKTKTSNTEAGWSIADKPQARATTTIKLKG